MTPIKCLRSIHAVHVVLTVLRIFLQVRLLQNDFTAIHTRASICVFKLILSVLVL